MGSLLVVSGPPRAGKSSVARLVADASPRSVLMAGDAFFAFLASGAIEPWRVESHEQNAVVTRAAALAAGEFVRGGYDVVYDGVIGPWFLDTFVAATGLPHLEYAVLLPPLEICRRRVADRVGHGFTDLDATAHMHRQFAAAGIADRHVVRNDGSTPAATATAIVGAQRRGELRYEPDPA